LDNLFKPLYLSCGRNNIGHAGFLSGRLRCLQCLAVEARQLFLKGNSFLL
jgi:hypothetical protein